MLNHYNLFRRKQEVDRCCAVRQDQPVPAFVRGDEWDFSGTFWDNGSGVPAGFESPKAREATQLSGFYIFRKAGPELAATAV